MNNIKSSIQLKLESLAIKESFKNKLNDLMEKYNIEDSVFQFYNGALLEATKGYFEVISEHDTFNDVMDNWQGHSVRIINNKKFQLGVVRNTISECQIETQIYDIDCGKSC